MFNTLGGPGNANKTTTRYHIIHQVGQNQTASVDGDVEKPSPSSLLVGVGNDALRQFLKMLEATGIPLLSVHPKELKPYPHKNIYTTNILSIIQSRQEMEITQVSIIHSLVNE